MVRVRMNRVLIAKIMVLIGLIGATYSTYVLAGWPWALLVGSISAVVFGLVGIDVDPPDDKT